MLPVFLVLHLQTSSNRTLQPPQSKTSIPLIYSPSSSSSSSSSSFASSSSFFFFLFLLILLPLLPPPPPSFYFYSSLLLVGLEFELRASHWQSRPSTA
jgi:hypothetical protein